MRECHTQPCYGAVTVTRHNVTETRRNRDNDYISARDKLANCVTSARPTCTLANRNTSVCLLT